MADAETLSGSVVLREPAALPAGPLLTVTLEDVSPADAAAVPLAHKRFEVKDQLAPIPFTLIYPTPAVRPGSDYAARARLTLGDRLLFTTTQRNSVDPLNPSPIELVVDSVAMDCNGLTFSQVASTMMAGPPEAMQQQGQRRRRR